jgi:uncharacterized SAM-binding protein YcdF (DUF218 family)
MFNKFIPSENHINNINLIASFLAQRDIKNLTKNDLNKCFGIKQADLLILLGNSIPYTAEIAANAFKNGVSKKFMIVGGKGHSTEYLRNNIKNHPKYENIETSNRAEADILKDIIVNHMEIDEKNIIVENKSTNCGSNAYESLNVMKKFDKKPKTIILIQDPTMQLRTFASFKHEWTEEKDVIFINYAPFIPQINISDDTVSLSSHKIFGLWDINRYLSLVMGEIPRLRDDKNGYGPKGKNFIEHVDIPKNIISAYEQLYPFYSEFINMRNILRN